MNALHRPVAVSVLGPPASGKSTLTSALATRHGGRIFRLREYAHRRAADEPALAAAMHARADALGWLPDRLALRLVGDALRGAYHPLAGAPVLLEGYPGNAVQAAHLAKLLRRCDGMLVVLDLHLDQDTAWQRARTRRVCPRCESDTGTDPHRPAPAAPDGECAQCAGPLRPRHGDTPSALAARADRFHQHRPQIRRALQVHHVPWHTLSTQCAPSAVLSAAEAALGIHPPLHLDPGAPIP
ncbi:nucleoside monophosphate kinase [Streptosporangium sp. CA-115845]|uniref:nucleoside monophosphate kinase n=1 Tax=Streptosporangium sp. CA-115845 TaxID=3240071 RepID=UPI003D90E2D7